MFVNDSGVLLGSSGGSSLGHGGFWVTLEDSSFFCGSFGGFLWSSRIFLESSGGRGVVSFLGSS